MWKGEGDDSESYVILDDEDDGSDNNINLNNDPCKDNQKNTDNIIKYKLNQLMMTRYTEKEEHSKAVLDQRIYHGTLCNFQAKRKHIKVEHVRKTKMSEDVDSNNDQPAEYVSKDFYRQFESLCDRSFKCGGKQAKITTASNQIKNEPVEKSIMDIDIETAPKIVPLSLCDISFMSGGQQSKIATASIQMKDEPVEESTIDFDIEASRKDVPEKTFVNQTRKITSSAVSHGSGSNDNKSDSNINEDASNINEDTSDIKNQFKCGFCDSSKPTVIDLIIHIQRSHRRLYKCDKCHFTTRTNTTFLLHAITHNRVNQVNNGSINNKNIADSSNNSSSSHSTLNCTICGMMMLTFEILLRHLKDSHIPPKQCTECDFKTKYQQCYDRHMGTHKKEAPCKYCDFVAKGRSNLENLKKHIDDTHRQPNHFITKRKGPNRIQYSCSICDYKTPRKELLRSHIRKHGLVPEEEKEFICPTCNFRTSSKDKLRGHQKRHEQRKYSCLSCNYCSKEKKTMRRHMLCHTSNPSSPV